MLGGMNPIRSLAAVAAGAAVVAMLATGMAKHPVVAPASPAVHVVRLEASGTYTSAVGTVYTAHDGVRVDLDTDLQIAHGHSVAFGVVAARGGEAICRLVVDGQTIDEEMSGNGGLALCATQIGG